MTFGDSLSDTGNAFALLDTTATPADYTLDPFLIPNAMYEFTDAVAARRDCPRVRGRH